MPSSYYRPLHMSKSALTTRGNTVVTAAQSGLTTGSIGRPHASNMPSLSAGPRTTLKTKPAPQPVPGVSTESTREL
jgi:hypothetical protein